MTRTTRDAALLAFSVLGAMVIIVGAMLLVDRLDTEDSGVAMCEELAEQFPKRAAKGEQDFSTLEEYERMRSAFKNSEVPDLRRDGVLFVELAYAVALERGKNVATYAPYIISAYTALSDDCTTYAGKPLPELAELKRLRQQSTN
jgi:hypothetical protein